MNTVHSEHAGVSNYAITHYATDTFKQIECVEKEDPLANYKCVEILAKIAADMKSLNENVRKINNTLVEQATRIGNIEQCLRNWSPKEGIVTPPPDEMLPKFPAETKKELKSLEKAVNEKRFELQILVSQNPLFVFQKCCWFALAHINKKLYFHF